MYDVWVYVWVMCVHNICQQRNWAHLSSLCYYKDIRTLEKQNTQSIKVDFNSLKYHIHAVY